MKAARVSAMLCAITSLFMVGFAHAQALDLGTEITYADFLKVSVGDYEVVKADNNDSHYKDGSVVSEDSELVFTFPYCPADGNVCDPGYVFLPKDPTDVKYYKKVNTSVSTLYTIVQKDGLDENTFEWEVPMKATEPTIFRRFNYVYGSKPAFTLAFELKKK